MAQAKKREMILVGFIQAANCSNYPGSWRHPATQRGFLTPDYYQDIARTLEAGKFHLAFIDDRLAMPSQYGDSFAESVRNVVRVVKLDLVPILMTMAWPRSTWEWGLPTPPPTIPHTMLPVSSRLWTISVVAAWPGTW